MKALDIILLNLKIISKIQENGRIMRAENGTISLYDNHSISFIERFFRGDSRKRGLNDVSMIIDTAIEKCNDILNSKFLEGTLKNIKMEDSFIQRKINTHYYQNCEIINIICSELTGCITGLNNWKTTYCYDTTTTSTIDILITKIKNFLSEMKKTGLIDSEN